MNTFSKLSTLIIPVVLITGCASTSEMDEMKASIAASQSAADSALSAAKQAQSTADSAQRTADSAELTANNAQTTAQNAQKTAERSLNAVDAQNIKINRMFEKSMSK